MELFLKVEREALAANGTIIFPSGSASTNVTTNALNSTTPAKSPGAPSKPTANGKNVKPSKHS